MTNSRDDTLQVLDIRKNSSLRDLKHASYKNGVNWNRAAVSPDAKLVVAGGACTYVALEACCRLY